MLALFIEGFKDLKSEKDKATAHKFMNDLIGDRLDLRLLCNHLIEINDLLQRKDKGLNLGKNSQRFIGVYDTQFNPADLCKVVYEEQAEMCIGFGLG